LAGLYSKYKEEKLMEFLKNNYNKLNIPKVIHYAQINAQWPELVFLYIHYDEFDNAALTIINHSADAWDHAIFKEVVPKVANADICYKAVQFYLAEHPLLINDLMVGLVPRVDHSRVVAISRRNNQLALIKPYLVSIQEKNITAVNEALNELYVEEEDWESLRSSIDHYDSFDPVVLAQNLEKHPLLEFRRIAAYLYKKNGRWAQSVELSKKDKLFRDAIETAAESKKQDVAESLVEYFVHEGKSECFAAALYTCYDVIRPDVALEYAWRYKLLDFAFPFLIQVVREYTSKVDKLVSDAEKKKAAEEKKAEGPQLVQEEMYINTMPQLTYYPGADQMGQMGGVMPGMGMTMPMTGMMPNTMTGMTGMTGLPGGFTTFQ
jgi:clathrin heavy chain